MADVVTICNLALSYLGDTAEVSSVYPPDSSVQAQLCAKFYGQARTSLLEMHTWGFATQRAALALLSLPGYDSACCCTGSTAGTGCATSSATATTTTATTGTTSNSCGQPWRFAYARPAAMIAALAVLPQGAPDDYEAWFGPVERDYFPPYPQGYLPVPGAPLYVPQPFALETYSDGTPIVLTNVCCATLRFTVDVTDSTKFTPLFTMALSYVLASMLAGPILKGDAGVQAAGQMMAMSQSWIAKAQASDSNQRKTRLEAAPSWIRGR